MSWRLEFYRRVGQGPLSREETDSVLGRFESLTRSTAPGEAPDQEEVLYQRSDPEAGVEYYFSFFDFPDPEGDEDPGRPDFPYERTPLELGVPFFQSEAAVREAAEITVEVGTALDLLVLDPQMEQEFPGRPDLEALVRSYSTYNRDVEETLAFVRRRGRTVAIAVLVVLTVIILWMALALIGRR